MYSIILSEFIPIRLHGSASVMNSFSIETASLIISSMTEADGLFFNILNTSTANSWCIPSSRLISSLLKHRPGSNPLFFNQKIAQKLPEKKIPSTHANAKRRSANGLSLLNHFMAHFAFLSIHGIVLIASNN